MLRTLLVEELAGRERSSAATRRAAAGFPTGKTFDAWNPDLSSIPAPTQHALRTLEWVGRAENLVVCGPSGTGKIVLPRSPRPVRRGDRRRGRLVRLESLGVLVRRHRADDTVDQGRRPDPASRARSSSMTSACCRSAPTPPKASTGSSTPPTNDEPWPSAPTCTPPVSTSSCPKPWPPPPSTGSCTTPTSASPPATVVRLAQATAGHGVTPLLEPGDHPTTNKRRLPKTIS